mgnify:CR=1 FL=1
MTTIDKALDALFLLSERAQALRLAEVARELGMPRSSAHRILAPLLRRGLAEQDSDGRYRAGFALMALGLNVASREPLATAAKPVLESAAADLGETFFLVVARAGKLVVLEKAEGSGFLRAALDAVIAGREREAERHVARMLLMFDDETLTARGYDRAEVDAFVDRLVAAICALEP